jgi:two-component system, OmpR family, sensor histidine kinase KdpD
MRDATRKTFGLIVCLRLTAACLAIFGVALFFKLLIPANATTVGFAFLITVLLVAAAWGLVESIAASFTAVLCLNFFFMPPFHTLTIADPENWIALFAFLVTSLVASELSERARRRAAEATSKQLEMERLYSLSRAILLMDSNQPTGVQIARELARVYSFPAVALYDRGTEELYRAGPEEIAGVETNLKKVALGGLSSSGLIDQVLVAPVALGGQPIGSLAIKGNPLSDTALHAVLNLVAVGLENARSRSLATRAEAARQSEEFKSTLLDGLAHEFKTPLTSIRAATSSLLTAGISEPDQRQELLSIIDEEAGRLSRLVTEALHLARIEAGKIQLNKQLHSIRGVIESVLKTKDLELEGRSVQLSIAEGLPEIPMDVSLMELALRLLLDNAIKYSPPASLIRITAELAGNAVGIGIRNRSESLSESEQIRIFEKFYRGTDARHRVAGSGLGLTVSREILLAHGGSIHVESDTDQEVEFVAVLPLAGGEVGR